MEIKEAAETVRVLADGVNPVTGEVLPAESPYNEPAVIRALFAVLGARTTVKRPSMTAEQKRKDNLDNGRPANAGLPWTEEMNAELESKYRGGASLDELRREFDRSRNAIASQLLKQGLLETAG